MWDRLKKEVAVDREQLNQLVQTHSALLRKCVREAPNTIERSALAALLHAFYTGIENIFKRISRATGGGAPGGQGWHRELLDSMGCRHGARSAVIPEELREHLSEYLAFRHVFRHAYTFHLRWEKMAHLVLECEQTLRQLEAQLDSFFESAECGEDR